MTTVVQTNYRPQIAAGLPGMIATEASSDCTTRICETAAGIPFGVAVSQGVGDKGAIIGGAKFLGLSVRDITLERVPLDPLSNVSTLSLAVDTYLQNWNMAVLTRGDMWVIAGADANAGDALFYEQTGGTLSNSASGTSANGSVTFTSNPLATNTITINGTAVTFVASGAAGNQVNIGPNLGDTLQNLATFLNASVDANLSVFKYGAFPASPGGAGQGSGANQLIYGAKTVGVAGNALVTTTTVPGATVQAMAGGTAAATAISGGFWKTSAISGQLAKVTLAIQR